MNRFVFTALAATVFIAGCSSNATDSSTPPAEIAVPIVESGTESTDVGAAAPSDAAPQTVTEGTAAASGEGAAATHPVNLDAGTATLAPENTTIQFVGTHMPPKAPDPRTGVFTKFSGKATIDPESKLLKTVSVDIDVPSLETGIAALTTHLRSPDFFDANQYPSAKFESTKVLPADGEANCAIVGNLTLMQTTKEIRIPARVTVTDQGMTLTGEFTIDRTQFGMTGMQEGVNKEVAMKVIVGQKTEVPQPSAGGPAKGGAGRSGVAGGGKGAPAGGFDPAAMFKQRDADGDGKLTGEEIAGRMRENLEEIDTDKDGAISEEEFQARMRQVGGGGPGARGGPGAGGPGGQRPGRPQRPANNEPK